MAGINRPRSGIAIIQNEGTDAYYFPILDMDKDRPADRAIGENFFQNNLIPF